MFNNYLDLFLFIDPSTLYAHLTILFHHDILCYLVLILMHVYYGLYILFSQHSWYALMFNVSKMQTSFFFNFWTLQNSFLNSFIFIFDYYFVKDDFLHLYFNSSNYFLKDSLLYNVNFYQYNSRHNIINYSYAIEDEKSSHSRYNPYIHSVLLEFGWVYFPSNIIIFILVPSILLIYSLNEDLNPHIKLNVMAHQWYWTYSMEDTNLLTKTPTSKLNIFSTIEFDSNIVVQSELSYGSKRLLTVDNPVYIPINVPVKYLISSSDVLHAWAVPAMGIKVDAVPGRLTQVNSILRRLGILYGQCSELCGVAHGFMPIMIHTYDYNVSIFHKEFQFSTFSPIPYGNYPLLKKALSVFNLPLNNSNNSK